MSDFDLHTLIREVCDASTIANPVTLAVEVGRRIDPADERAALDQALPTVVRHIVSLARGSHSSPGGHSNCGTQEVPAAGANHSRKVAGIRAYGRRLRERISVGPTITEWKFLGDCTATDLEYAATVNDNNARWNTAKAAEKRRLAAALAANSVNTVRELPTDILTAALEGEAAA